MHLRLEFFLFFSSAVASEEHVLSCPPLLRPDDGTEVAFQLKQEYGLYHSLLSPSSTARGRETYLMTAIFYCRAILNVGGNATKKAVEGEYYTVEHVFLSARSALSNQDLKA